jgi:hypothetical protein
MKVLVGVACAYLISNAMGMIPKDLSSIPPWAFNL